MKRGEIYLLKLPKNLGNIQAGIRPVIVIQNDIGNHFSPTTIVCSITSVRKKHLPTHVHVFNGGGLRKHSIILCEQIFTVNKNDLIQHIGTITNKHILNRLNNCVRLSLGVL